MKSNLPSHEKIIRSGHNFCINVITAELSRCANLWPDWVIKIRVIAKRTVTRFRLWAHDNFVTCVIMLGWGIDHVKPLHYKNKIRNHYRWSKDYCLRLHSCISCIEVQHTCTFEGSGCTKKKFYIMKLYVIGLLCWEGISDLIKAHVGLSSTLVITMTS